MGVDNQNQLRYDGAKIRSGNTAQEVMKMRTPKEIAVDIHNGDTKAKAELEKMMGKNFNDMTTEERRLGVACLSAFEKLWNK